MIIKHADRKLHDIETLQSLLAHPSANGDTRKRIEQEIRNIKSGVRGESEAAHEMKVHYGQSKNWAIIHDLRVIHGDLVAQIDHLIINRWLDIWVCESKHFSEGFTINEHGEFTAFFAGKPYGVPSPIEQNQKHLLILRRILDSGAVELPKRLGFTIKPELKSLVLISKSARISRPSTKIDGIEYVIKNDQIFKYVDKAVDENGVLSTAKVVSSETLANVATRIAALHRPIQFDWHARFGLDKTPSMPEPSGPPRVKPEPAVLGAAQDGETEPAPNAQSDSAVCRSCRSDRIAVRYGKFGYYFKCFACDGNTPIKIGCGKEGHKERIRKEGSRFYRECADCKTSSLYFENRQ